MNKKNGPLIALTFVLTLVLAFVSLWTSEKNNSINYGNNNVAAQNIEYSLSFNSSQNKFSASSNSTIVNTGLGNPITFSYSGYTGALGKWGNFGKNGYFQNETAISGLQSISVNYGTSTGNLQIYYGWWNDFSQSIVYDSSDGQISSDNYLYDFDYQFPSYFKVVALDVAQINTMTIKYSCVSSEKPDPSTELLTFTKVGNEYSVTDSVYSITSITIPSIYRGYPVTGIGEQAFARKYSLTSVTLPSTLTTIGSYSFFSCTSLTSILIPDSVTTIGNSAFSNCPSLVNLSFSSSLLDLGLYAFRDCTALTNVYLPSSLTTIRGGVFSGCTSLINIFVDEENPNYSSLDGLLLNKSGQVLESWPAGRTLVELPSTITEIGNGAFSGMLSLVSMGISESITKVGESAFENCTNLKYIVLTSSLRSIGWYAFNNCTSLLTISIPDSVTFIGGNAFANCTSLQYIYCSRYSKPSDWSSSWNTSNIPVSWSVSERPAVIDGGFIVRGNSWANTNATISEWLGSGTVLKIPETLAGYTITNLQGNLAYRPAVEYLDISDKITTLSEYSLSSFLSLKTLILGSGITSIGIGSFGASLPDNEYSVVFYRGTPEQWQLLNFTHFEDNGYTIVYYSDQEKVSDEFYYWHYEADGFTPQIWGL